MIFLELGLRSEVKWSLWKVLRIPECREVLVWTLFPEFWVGIGHSWDIPMARLKLRFPCQGVWRILRVIPIHKQGLRLILMEGVLSHVLNRDSGILTSQ